LLGVLGLGAFPAAGIAPVALGPREGAGPRRG
jgi:hypothetical protein